MRKRRALKLLRLWRGLQRGRKNPTPLLEVARAIELFLRIGFPVERVAIIAGRSVSTIEQHLQILQEESRVQRFFSRHTPPKRRLGLNDLRQIAAYRSPERRFEEAKGMSERLAHIAKSGRRA